MSYRADHFSRSVQECVYVLDDDQLLVRLIAHILENEGYQVLSYTCPLEFLKLRSTAPICCLLVDLEMPGMRGLQVQKEIKDRGWTMPLIFMSAHGSIGEATEAMKLGAVDFLEKPMVDQRLVSVVEDALESCRQRNRMVGELNEARDWLDNMTEREKEVMKLLLAGYINKQVAATLGITERTVKAHRASIMEKSGVDSLALLVPLAMKSGLTTESRVVMS
ncbi:response regulator transcription factor [Phragmitibacter flavus]|uniref:Response regulator transcription factor n=1 Tax=Phragmitibacter flavus TaxID=2576071 RepID=A0A5R8KEM4_9BACT|nr:response regulator [Phragmitibacter flavus]TLD70734.1 response regulator transcription factor [Phragmitibacter flavus]